MLPILPLLFLLLFPHASGLRGIEAGEAGGRHEIRLHELRFLVRAVEAAREDEASGPKVESGARRIPLIIRSADGGLRSIPRRADRVRDGPLS